MTTTLIAPQQQIQEAPQQAREAPPTRRRLPTAVVVVAVLALAAVLGGLGYALQQYLNGSSTTTAPASTLAWTYDYGFGSTVYAEQVPAEAAAYQSMMEGYGPTSTVRAEQVPVAPWWAAYGPGSSLFSEQVPTG